MKKSKSIFKFSLVLSLLAPIAIITPIVLSSCSNISHVEESVDTPNDSNKPEKPNEPESPQKPEKPSENVEKFFLTQEEESNRAYEIFSKLNWGDNDFAKFIKFLNRFNSNHYPVVQSSDEASFLMKSFLDKFVNENNGKQIVEKYVKLSIYQKRNDFLSNILFSNIDNMVFYNKIDKANMNLYKNEIINNIMNSVSDHNNISINVQSIFDQFYNGLLPYQDAPNIFDLSNSFKNIDVSSNIVSSLKVKLVPFKSQHFSFFFGYEQINANSSKDSNSVKAIKINSFKFRHDLRNNGENAGIYSYNDRIASFGFDHRYGYIPLYENFDIGFNHNQYFLEFLIDFYKQYYEKHM